MKKPNVGQYFETINQVITETEAVGENMHPFYDVIRQAIDSDDLESLTSERLREIKQIFSEGTDSYRVMSTQVKTLKAPIKVLGVHKKLDKAFEEYVKGCQEMVDSIDEDSGTVNVELFNQSESIQDVATEQISFCIQRITQLILNH